ncbi:MAG: 3-deoxy-manno-octulosonate cytidylyltransferase [Candidatus Eisenbacteria bacterium]|nr:3-deoxy-manno-octulosonate cytidylyltransferase [Candidatus Eisenbacteria bacterium]
MRVAGIIPARYASSRFNGKALALIEGKTLIRHVYERALSSRCLNELMVATDDSRIAREVEGFGGKAVLTSPEHKCGTERAAEVARKLDADFVVNIQGDEMISAGEMIDECVSPLLGDSSLNVSTLAVEIRNKCDLNDPNVVKVVRGLNGDALFFSRSPIPYAPLASLGTVRAETGVEQGVEFLRHVGIYGFKRTFLLDFVRLGQTPLELAECLEQLRILERGHRIAVVLTNHSCVGVDVPSDIKKATAFLASLAGPVHKGRVH